MPQIRSQRVLRDARAWAQQNRILLEICFAEFRSTGRWPRLETLEHRLEHAGHTTIAAEALAREMPEPLGFAEQGHLVLMCRGLLEVNDAEGLLEDWFNSVRLAYDRWMEDPNNELDSEEVAAQLGGDAERLRQVSMLLLREGWMFGSGSGDAAGSWTREIVAGVRVARDAEDARELLDARAAVEWSDAEPPLAVGTAGPEGPSGVVPEGIPRPTGPTGEAADISRPRRFWRYVTGNAYLAAIAATFTLAVLAALYKGATVFVESFDSSSSSAAHPHMQQAGEGGARTFPVPGVLSREGPPVKPGERVRVRCRVYAPRPASVVPDGNWYRLASAPWNGQYFAPANSFWNGDVPGRTPYTHNTDFSVPVCR